MNESSELDRVVAKIKQHKELTPKEVQTILDATDWTNYWRRVDEAVVKNGDKYRRASALSLSGSGSRVII